MITICLSSCSSPETKYKQAQHFIVQGDFSSAAKTLDDLGSYEDAPMLSVYCKACYLAENSKYSDAISALESLGSYRDCQMRIPYYKARSIEEEAGTTNWSKMIEAQSIYSTMPLYLDSMQRINALDNRINAAKDDQYNAAVVSAESGQYDIAIQTLNSLGDYKDSQSRIRYFNIREAEEKIATNQQDEFIAVQNLYRQMLDYLDCSERADALLQKANEIVTNKYITIINQINSNKLSNAEASLLEFGDYGNERVTEFYYLIGQKYITQKKWQNAISAFTYAGEYQDAITQISATYYLQAEDCLSVGDEASAIVYFKKSEPYSNATERWKDIYYNQAINHIQENSYIHAYEILISLEGYKDSDNRASSIKEKYKLAKLQDANIGDYIIWGEYEQDNIKANGKEDIEWLVLAAENNRLLVISRFALDGKLFNTYQNDITWEHSTLRRWLNNDFFKSSFSDAERVMIQNVVVSADKNDYRTNPGNATKDRIFLLSIDEANEYFDSTTSRRCKLTEYSKSCGVFSVEGLSCWWLRTPGMHQDYAAVVFPTGSVDSDGLAVWFQKLAVRPAMWIQLNPLTAQ